MTLLFIILRGWSLITIPITTRELGHLTQLINQTLGFSYDEVPPLKSLFLIDSNSSSVRISRAVLTLEVLNP